MLTNYSLGFQIARGTRLLGGRSVSGSPNSSLLAYSYWGRSLLCYMGRNSVWDIVQIGIGLLLVQVNNDIWTKNLIQRYRFLMGACPTHVREKWINWFITNRRSWRIRGRTASGTSTATALLEAMSEEAKIFTVFLAGVWGGFRLWYWHQ